MRLSTCRAGRTQTSHQLRVWRCASDTPRGGGPKSAAQRAVKPRNCEDPLDCREHGEGARSQCPQKAWSAHPGRGGRGKFEALASCSCSVESAAKIFGFRLKVWSRARPVMLVGSSKDRLECRDHGCIEL